MRQHTKRYIGHVSEYARHSPLFKHKHVSRLIYGINEYVKSVLLRRLHKLLINGV